MGALVIAVYEKGMELVRRTEDQGEEQLGVEGGGTDETEDGVHFEALAGEEAVVHGHFGGCFGGMWG